ncbi:heterokaryon incompatibility protein-domain-containing protein, partial [Dactylonectria estremocensis]
MRLINIETLMLEEYFGNDIPPYAILSHTWGNDDEEITFRDIEAGRVEKNGSGSSKVRGCCNQARKDGLKYVWIDTCCIDKSSSSELSDCINSMFQWYETASVCYAYLADVPAGDNPRQPDSKFFSSRWFERGWTLQELLAPERVCFYDATWDLLGTKVNLAGAIQSITGIPRHFLLRSVALQSASIAERMSWAAKRRTKREEDLAYCLLGIFNVMMPMLYGERHNAFRRLQEEIMKHGGDDSILAWGFNGNGPEPDTSAIPSPKGPLAASPSDFANSGEIISGYQIPMHTSSIEISADWLRIHLPLHTTPTGNIYGVMKCFQPQCSAEQVVGVPLQKLDSLSHSYIRPPGQPPILLSRSASAAPTNHISVWNPKEGGTSNNQQHWFYIEESKGIDLELIEVEPRHRWLRDKSIITTDNNPSGTNAFQHTLARFRSKTDHSHDIMIVLEYYTSPVKAQFYAMSLSSDATLAEVLSNLEYLLPKAAGKRQVSTSVIHVGVDVTERPIAGQPLFVVSLFSTSHDPETVTTDASSELHVLKSKSRFVEMLHEEDTTESKSRDFDQQAKQQLTVLGEKHAQISAVREKIRKLKEEETLLIEEAEKAAQGAQDAE